MTPEEIISERRNTHGDFKDVSAVVDATHAAWEAATGHTKLSPQQAHALSMIAVKVARILCGDPNYPDHFLDIAGYAMLGANSIKEPSNG